jgi:AraC family transcriptional regulator
MDVMSQVGVNPADEADIDDAVRRETADTIVAAVSSLLVAAAFGGAPTRAEPALNDLDDVRLLRVVEHIDLHLNEDLSIEVLAGIACLSVFHFCRLFRATVGIPPNRYVTEKRLEKAMELLTGGARLCEVALTTGFASQASFSRTFKRLTGMTPGTYRRSRRPERVGYTRRRPA